MLCLSCVCLSNHSDTLSVINYVLRRRRIENLNEKRSWRTGVCVCVLRQANNAAKFNFLKKYIYDICKQKKQAKQEATT